MTVERAVETTLPTAYGVFRCAGYVSEAGHEHVALWMGTLRMDTLRMDTLRMDTLRMGEAHPQPADSAPLVRIHSECLTGDVLGSLRCDCGPQLDRAMALIAAEGCGVVVYMRGHEGRGIGLIQKLHAYRLQDGGFDTVDANLELGFEVDERSYDDAAAILGDLGLRRLRLLSNNPRKRLALEDAGIEVVEAVSLWTVENAHNQGYLATKRERMGHRDDPARDVGLPVSGRGPDA